MRLSRQYGSVRGGVSDDWHPYRDSIVMSEEGESTQHHGPCFSVCKSPYSLNLRIPYPRVAATGRHDHDSARAKN